MALMDALEWRQARQWLIASEVIPATHRVTKPDVDLIDFARSLRDGTFLCSLLLKLKSDCIEDWTPKPIMQHHYLKNISAFLQACSSRFGMKETDLFTELDLYDVDNFQKVMRCLSQLSHTPEALSLGLVPFPREETRDYYNQVNSDDIYASLRDIGMANDADRLYANVGELYAQEDPYGYGDESIYDSICYYQAPPIKTTDADEKKKYVLQELFETERSFVTVLTLINNDFYSTLHDHLSAEDTDLLFSTAKLLLPVHKTLLDGFERCVELWGKDASKTDISSYFLDSRTGLLQYGIYAARLPMAVQKAKQLQTRGETSRMLQVCQDHSNQRFPLSDLLNVPIQRFLKYPLLVKELKKVAPKCAMASSTEVSNLEVVFNLLEDIARYINASKGDYEGMQQIEEVEQSLTDYGGPPLLQCGRYHLDGELRFKAVEGGGGGGIKPNPRWVFLFDKVMLVCKKVNIRMGFTVRYSPKLILSVSNLKVETLPLHRGGKRVQFSYSFQVATHDQGDFTVFAKTEELKSQWIDAINHAKEMCAPRDGRKGLHTFELHTFDQPCYCDVCQKLLHGCYYQGYYCPQCQRAAHRDCLKDIERCSTFQPMPPPTGSNHRRIGPRSSSELPHLAASASSLTTTRPASRRPGTMSQNGIGTIFIAKQRYDAIGNRINRVLSFERGEELEVMNPNAALEWWEAISLKTGNKGEVPPSYLIRKDDSHGAAGSFSEENTSVSPGRLDDRLRGYPWYLGKKSRIEAEQALHKMRDGVFLIRESDVRPGEYAIALKWKRMPKHIKVCKHPETRKFYVSDVCEFLSVADLVNYYQQTSLGASFPGVDTTLKYPYKDMVEGGGASGGGGVSTGSLLLERPKGRSMSQPPPPSLATPLPPATSSNPQPEGWAEVLFRFIAEFQDELSIERHDKIKILRKMTDKTGWWLGEAANGQTGLFPSNYVREMDS